MKGLSVDLFNSECKASEIFKKQGRLCFCKKRRNSVCEIVLTVNMTYL